MVSQVDGNLANQLKAATVLTKYATAYRYPEEAESPEPLTHQNCEKICAIAKSVFENLNSIIKSIE